MYIKYILISNFFIIVRHFMEMAQFIDSALSENGKVFVNCVFGRSRYTVTIIVTFTIFTIIVLAEAKKTFQVANFFLAKLSWSKIRYFFKSVLFQSVFNKYYLSKVYFGKMFLTCMSSKLCEFILIIYDCFFLAHCLFYWYINFHTVTTSTLLHMHSLYCHALGA